MKKMLIAAVAVVSVIASIVGCQVYDSQTNENLYHAGQKLEDLADEFNTNCVKMYENSTDVNAYNAIIDAFWSFTEHFERKTAMVQVKKDITNAQNTELDQKLTNIEDEAEQQRITNEIRERDNAILHDSEKCKDKYKEYMTPVKLYGYVMAYVEKCFTTKYGVMDDAFVPDPQKSAAENTEAQNKWNKEKAEYDKNRIDFYATFEDFKDLLIYGNDEQVASKKGWTIPTLWEKTYKLRWDYNSKK